VSTRSILIAPFPSFEDVEGGWAHAAQSHVVSSPPEESLEALLAFPQAEALLEPVLVAPLPQEPLEPVFVEPSPGALRRDLGEKVPSESVSLSPRKLLLNAFAVLGSFPLKCLFPLLPSWSRPKWWSVCSHHAFNVLYRAPPSSLVDTADVSSTLLPLR